MSQDLNELKLEFKIFLNEAIHGRNTSFNSHFSNREEYISQNFRFFINSLDQKKYPLMKECFNWSIRNPNSFIEVWYLDNHCLKELSEEVMYFLNYE